MPSDADLPGYSSDFIEIVYDELRRLAAHRISNEPTPQTLTATSLVHEAWLRIKGKGSEAVWNHRRHFFNAAAEAMRRILIERARAKKRIKRDGGVREDEFPESRIEVPREDESLLSVSEALDRLHQERADLAELVRLRYFVGCNWSEISELLDTSETTLRRKWRFAKAWLRSAIDENAG